MEKKPKRKSAWFCEPAKFDIPSAFRWAVIIDLGGDERLVRSILGTRIGEEFGNDDFWKSVFRFFIAHPELASRHHGPIVDYLFTQIATVEVHNNQRFVVQVRGRLNKRPSREELAMLGRWQYEGGPRLSRWLTT